MPDTFSVRLPDDLRAEIDRIAESIKRSRAFIIKEDVEAYVAEQRAYDAAVAEAIIEADKGVFVSGKRVQQWLRDLQNDPNTPDPEPDIFKK